MMDSNKNDKNNLFMWATKELSQDALIAWLLNWKEGDVGKCFLNSMIGNEEKDYTIKQIYTQKDSIDVLVECERKDNNWFYVIIEDKTNTFLHSNQMIKYISTVSNYKDENEKKFDTIYYVLFKTGQVYKWEQEDFENQEKKIENKLKCGNNDGEIEFKISDLNDTIKNEDKELLISGSWAKKSIVIKKKKIKICKIYNAKNFKNTYNRIKGKMSDDTKVIWKKIGLDDYIKNINPIELDIAGGFYNKIAELLNKGKTECETRVVLPSGQGERDYDCCIYHKDFFNYEKDGEKVALNNLKSNYLILPFISLKKIDDKKYKISFKIQYQLIVDYKIKNGYKSYRELKNIINKATLDERMEKAKESFKGIKEEWFVDGKQDNKLLFFKNEIEIDDLKGFIESGDDKRINDNLRKLIDISNEIKKKTDLS